MVTRRFVKKNNSYLKSIFFAFVSFYSCLVTAHPLEDIKRNVYKEITREALAPSFSDRGYPLPLVGHWNSGKAKGTYSPSYQFSLIEKGHHILPWFHINSPFGKGEATPDDYYSPWMEKARKYRLPIALISTQWERVLAEDPKFTKRPADRNPNTTSGKELIIPTLSPMGLEDDWYRAGKSWTSRALIASLQKKYPDPPLVLFVSNNEQKKLKWFEIEKDARINKEKIKNLSENNIKQYLSARWARLYKSLFLGFREGLGKRWSKSSKFVGYNAFLPMTIGRWSGWGKYSLSNDKEISPWSDIWEGASIPFYVHDWDQSTDYNVWGPVIASQNLVGVKDRKIRSNPDYWFEVSIWDGNQPRKPTDKISYYKSLGQTYDPRRYRGMVNFSLWLLRPRLIREFRNPDQTVDTTGVYFDEVLDAVDSVYRSDILTKFWREGRLVENNEDKHPYDKATTPEFKSMQKWYLLKTNLDPRRPWNLSTEIPVISIALTIGQLGEREWLVYAYSPLIGRNKVLVSIPNYKEVAISASPSGDFFYLSEQQGSVKRISN